MPRRKCEFEPCKKLLDLTAFACKCDKYFCAVHRGNYDHSCTFDYKSDYKNVLLKTLSTIIVARKVDII